MGPCECEWGLVNGKQCEWNPVSLNGKQCEWGPVNGKKVNGTL